MVEDHEFPFAVIHTLRKMAESVEKMKTKELQLLSA